MTAQTKDLSEKARFYFAVQVAEVAWIGIALSVGGAFAIASVPLFVLTMLGMLAILAVAMRQPTYIGIRPDREQSTD
jgi:apolipoprotein N-acyltransferase